MNYSDDIAYILSKSRDNGAVLFVFVGDRKIRIEVGYGLEGALPDALASRIINEEITPRFREGKYEEGVLAGVEAIILATRGEYQPAAEGRASSANLLIVALVLFFLFMGVVVPILRIVGELRGSRTYSGHGTSRGRRGSTWGSGGGFSSGGAGPAGAEVPGAAAAASRAAGGRSAAAAHREAGEK